MMAHPINDLLNRLEKRIPIKCDESCKYWSFPHLERACVLSEVFSVNKGCLCYEYKLKDK
jgi:hypothetical protein